MKLGFFADLHLDTKFGWAKPAVARKRRQILRDALKRLVEEAKREKVDLLLCAGDLFEQERFSPDTISFLQAEFEELAPIPIYIAPGNHDWYGPDSPYQCVEWPSNVGVFADYQLEPIVPEDGLTVWGAAHHAPANTDNFLEGFGVDRGGVNIGSFHGSEVGLLPFEVQGKRPHAAFRSEQIARAGLDHCLVGHYHTPRDADLLTYAGNPAPLTFGQNRIGGLVLITFQEDGSFERERRAVSLLDLQDFSVDVTGRRTREQVVDAVRASIVPLCSVCRVTLSGELPPEIDLQTSDLETAIPEVDALIADLSQLRFAYDIDAIKQEQTVRGQFVNDVLQDRTLDEQRRDRVLQTGLRALDRRQDFEVM